MLTTHLDNKICKIPPQRPLQGLLKSGLWGGLNIGCKVIRNKSPGTCILFLIVRFILTAKFPVFSDTTVCYMYLEILCQCWTDCKTFYRSCATFLPSFEEMNFPTRQNHNVKTKSYQHLCKVASLRRRLYDVFSQLHYACLDLSHDTKIPAWPVLWPMMIRSACVSVHIKGTFFCWKSKADRSCMWIEKALNSPNLRWPNIS